MDAVAATRYQDVLLPTDAIARLSITSGTAILRYDSNGDGSVDTVAPPSTVQSGATLDKSAPRISWTLTTEGNQRIVSLTATDEGSGLSSIHYSTDGTNFVPYAGPLSFDQNSASLLHVFADDNSSNRAGMTISVDGPPPVG